MHCVRAHRSATLNNKTAQPRGILVYARVGAERKHRSFSHLHSLLRCPHEVESWNGPSGACARGAIAAVVPRARSAQFPSRHPSYTQLQAVHCCISIRRHIRSPTLAASFVASLPQNGGILTRREKGKKKVNKTWRAHSCGSVPTQVCHSLCMLCGSRRGRCDVVLQQYTAFFSADPRNDTATHERASPHDKTLVSVPDHVLDERGQPHHVRHSSADDQREKIPSEGVRMLFRLTARVFQPLSPIGMNEDLELGHAPPGAIPEAFAMGRRPRSLPSPMAFRSDRTHMRCAELMEELLY